MEASSFDEVDLCGFHGFLGDLVSLALFSKDFIDFI